MEIQTKTKSDSKRTRDSTHFVYTPPISKTRVFCAWDLRPSDSNLSTTEIIKISPELKAGFAGLATWKIV
jgi:hypothetical protein